MNHVFLSYRHESDDHAKAVRTLGEMLKAADLPVELDQFYIEDHPGGPNETWPKWCEDRAVKSACVLIVCSKGWFDSYRMEGQVRTGLGAALEAAIFSQEIYDDKGYNARVRLVILDNFNEDGIPLRLKGWHIFRPFSSDAAFDQMTKWIRRRLAMPDLAGTPQQQPDPSAQGATDPKFVASNIPDRNPFFTGREAKLAKLQEVLSDGGRAALSGLGGIGKTQTALGYAYRHSADYSNVFWATADSKEAAGSGYATIAKVLELPEAGRQDQIRAVNAVQRWFCSHQRWLLILDNVDNVESIREFIPPGNNGHIILTTRARATAAIARRLDIEKMTSDEGALLLLRRSKYISENEPLEVASELDQATAKKIVVELDGLPLALDQAAAYIEETGCGLSDYLSLYLDHAPALLRRRGILASHYPDPVASTWALSFENVEKSNPAAAEILRLCAFLNPPDGIPEEVFKEGAPELGPLLKAVASDTLAWNDALSEILKYSLIRRDPSARTLEMHRLVQVVLRQGMDDAAQRLWAERAVRAVGYKVHPASISPDGKYGVIYCSNPEIVRYEESRMVNYVVGLIPFQIIGLLEGDIHFAHRNHSNLSVTWTDDSLTALVTVDGKWGPRSVVLIEISDGKLVRQTNLLEKARALLKPDCESCNSEPYNEWFLFLICTQRNDEWSFDGTSRVRIDCTGESNPKQLPHQKSWVAHLEAIWDVKQANFIQTKVNRILCGYCIEGQ